MTFAFPIHSRNPYVERICVHFLLQHHIVFSGNQSLSCILQRLGVNRTMLTNLFEWNKTNIEAKSLYYSQFPNKYVWDAGQNKWIPMSRGFCLGRMIYIHSDTRELYFLRLLLGHVKGATCFDDLSISSRTIYPTFQFACRTLGPFGDVKEWVEAFTKVIATTSL